MTSYASTFEIEQKVNRCHRRCVIGKVTKKFPTPFDVWPYLTPPADIWPSFVQYFGNEPRKCSCAPGTACGNVACPYLPIVTC